MSSTPKAEDHLRLRWQFKEHRDGETARYQGAGFSVFVQDCDGDFSWWIIRRHDTVIAESRSVHGSNPYHFDAALAEAEAALRNAVSERRASLRTNIT